MKKTSIHYSESLFPNVPHLRASDRSGIPKSGTFAGNPEGIKFSKFWIPAFAGMTLLFIFHSVVFSRGEHSARSDNVAVTVDAARVIHTVNPWLYGINTARWDESLFPGPADEMLLTCDRDAIQKIKASGVTLLKYPGGNDADHYIWNAPSNNSGDMNTDEYIALCREVGAEPFITINFNEPPSLAAEWVRYCNNVRGYDVKLWEVGDEQWGTWAKGHSTPEAYAEKFVSFVKAMKGVDSTIKVAINVALTGNSPSLGSRSEGWTPRVLRAADGYYDLLTFTYFPLSWGKENDDTLFASTGWYRKLFLELKETVERTLGKEKSDKLLFINVGYNSVNHSPGPQTVSLANALWTADMVGTMAEVKTDISCFWALHNEYPPRGGDFGYLSSDGKNTPRYDYYVFPMFAKHFGSEIVSAASDNADVSVYAARDGKRISVALINKSVHKPHHVQIALRDFVPAENAQAWILDRQRKNEQLPDIFLGSGYFTVDAPSYSFLMLSVISRDSVVPPLNIALTATASASSYSPENALWGPGDFEPAKAIDGIMDTRWRSGILMKPDENQNEWLQLMWKQPQRIAGVKIFWGENYASDYRVEVSTDGKKWKTIRTVSNGNGGVESFEFQNAASARYLRVSNMSGGKKGSSYTMKEIEVYQGVNQ
ncbi:MAG: discoidin domain-containing protein [Bacteroidota bacterium]|nr:discoidin domain-containing protein [Bacteroidota bacterium]